MRIGLFGNFGGGNLGNEGTLEAMLLFLRQSCPDADLVCLCVEPAVVTARYGVRALSIRQHRSASATIIGKIRKRFLDQINMFRNFRDIDVLLVPGTGIMDDFGERPQGFPYIVFLAGLMAKLRGVKVAYVSIGAGPIRHPLSRWLMKTAARMAAYRSYRDTVSKDFMQSIGVNVVNDPVYPDLVFGLPNPEPARRPANDALTVGLGVMAYYGWNAVHDEAIYRLYLSKLTTFAIWLLNNGYSIRLLIGEDTDEKAVKDLTMAIAAEIGAIPEGRIVAEAPRSLHEVMTQFSAVDAVIATRFHNVLCALKVGAPTISLGYAKKNDVLMAALGLDEFCQHVESFDVELLIQQFTKLIERRAFYAEVVKGKGANLRRQLEQQQAILMSSLISRPDAPLMEQAANLH